MKTKIHMLFEHGFYLKILKTGWGLFAWHYVQNVASQNGRLSMLLLTSTLLVEMMSLKLKFGFANWRLYFNDFPAFSVLF